MIGLIIFIVLLYVSSKSKSKCLVLTIVMYPTLQLFPIIGAGSIFFFIVLLFLLSDIKNVYKIKDYPFLLSIIFCLISYLGTAIVSGYMISSIVGLFSNLGLCFLLWNYRKKIDMNYFCKVVIIYSSVICVYGIIESFLGYNPVLSFLRSLNLIDAPEQQDDYVRFGMYRAQSLTIWCSIYGITCALSFLLLANAMIKKYIKKSIFLYVLLLMLFFGVLLSGTRTCIAFWCIGMLSISPYFLKRFRLIIGVSFVLVVIFFCFWDYIMLIIDSFINSSDAGGSSPELRYSQLQASLSFLRGHYFWGNGLGSMPNAMNMNAELYGGESILFWTIVERGMVGVISLILFALNVLFVFVKRKCFWLSFIVIAFFFAKYNSLIPGLSEVYILSYIGFFFYYESANNNEKIFHKES